MYGEIKQEACDANKMLPQHGLVKFTWGNVSQRDAKKSIFAIKPSGVEYADLVSSKIVVLHTMGNVLVGDMKPSSDIHTHTALYEAFSEIGGIVHTHSSYLTAFAQAISTQT